MIYQELNTSDVATLLRADEHANWSADAAWAIAERLCELFDEIGEDFEFDRVAVRCDYSEYSIGDLYDAYSHIVPENSNPIDQVDEFLEALQDHGADPMLLDNGNVVIRDF